MSCCFDLHQERWKSCIKTEIFSRKVLVVQKKTVPLHPLSKRGEWLRKSSLKDLHRQK